MTSTLRPTPRIFVSHSHHDNRFCISLVDDLRNALGNDEDTVWFDVRGGLHGGDAWWSKIENEITARPIFVVILSPDAVQSHWVNDEINIAWRQKNTPAGKLIIPLLLRPCQIRPSLQTLHIISFERHRPYTGAFAELLSALKLSLRAPQSTTTTSPPPTPVALPGTPRPLLKPLYDLGYAAREVSGVEAILPPLCSVPAGPFTMGSDPERDPDAYEDETPQYMIEVGAFQIARFPVTVAEYACAVRAGAVPAPKAGYSRVSWQTQQEQLDQPVVNVSWFDAMGYAMWLAKTTGQPWRLPTEAEWEKAARGTDGRIYPWGDEWDETRANSYDSGLKTTTPVGSYPNDASPYGVQDLAGNVREWCSSLYKPYPYCQQDGRELPDSPEGRVVRGGSWGSFVESSRVAHRHVLEPGLPSLAPSRVGAYQGFRLVCATRTS